MGLLPCVSVQQTRTYRRMRAHVHAKHLQLMNNFNLSDGPPPAAGQTFTWQQHGCSPPGDSCVSAVRQVLLETFNDTLWPEWSTAQSRGYEVIKCSEDVILDVLPEYDTACTHSEVM